MKYRNVEEEVCYIVRDWCKKGLIKKGVMLKLISLSSALSLMNKQSVIDNYVVTADYVRYLVPKCPNYFVILADLKSTNEELYKEVIFASNLKELAQFVDVKSLNNKNDNKSIKILRQKIDREVDKIIEENKDEKLK